MEKELQSALDELREFCSRHSRIAICGAGEMGRLAAKFLKQQHIHFDCFCATRAGKDFFEGLPVLLADEIAGQDTGVIVAVAKWNFYSVLKRLQSLNTVSYYANWVFVDYLFQKKYENYPHEFETEDGYLVKIGDRSFDKDTYCVACTGGIGDTLYICGLMEAFRERHPEFKRVCLIVNEKRGEMASAFPGISEVIASDEMIERCRGYALSTSTMPLKNYQNERRGSGVETIHDIFWNSFMGVPDEVPLTMPDFRAERYAMPRRERTIVIIPHSNSAPFLPEVFWNMLAARLKEKGYAIYTNVVKAAGDQALEGTCPLEMGLLETVAFCESCDMVIALRCGMCDLLAFSKASQIVLNSAKYYFETWNLKDVFDREDIYNVNCFQNPTHEETIRQIMEILDTRRRRAGL